MYRIAVGCVQVQHVCITCHLHPSRVVKFLLEKGADVNVKDEFSSATRVAQQERVSPSKGEHLDRE